MNRFLRFILIALLCGGCLPGSAGAEERLVDYPAQAELAISGEGPWYRLAIPMSVQLAAHYADLRDVRVFNAAGEVLPYALTKGFERHARAQRQVEARLFPLYDTASATDALPDLRIRRNESGMVIELSAAAPQSGDDRMLRGWLMDVGDADFPLNRLKLDWRAASEGFQRFRIEASDDLIRWSSWGEGQIARLSFDGERIDQNEITLPGRQTRYLRLLWLQPERGAVIDRARVEGNLDSIEPAPLVWSEPLDGQTGAGGEFVWSLPLALPLERVHIPVSQINTVVPVQLFGRADAVPTPSKQHRQEAPWALLTRGVLYRLSMGERETAQEELQLSGRPVRQFKLQLDRRGGRLGEGAPKLKVALRGSELVFLAQGAGPYRLAFGKPRATADSLPLATLIPGYEPRRWQSLGTASIAGPLHTSPPAAASADSEPADWKKMSLWAVLLAGVALLAVMAFSLLRSSSSRK